MFELTKKELAIRALIKRTEAVWKPKRNHIANLRTARYKRALKKWIARGHPVKAEHAIKMGAKAVKRYATEGLTP